VNQPQNIQFVGSGQIQVQEHEVVRLVANQTLRLFSVGNYLYGKLLLFQLLVQKLGQRRVIFSDKNAHRLTQTT
jgi:hypothetical protein